MYIADALTPLCLKAVRLLTLAGVILLGVTVASCDGSEPSSSSSSESASRSTSPSVTLLIADPPTEKTRYPQAIVKGVLAKNNRDCLALGDFALVASFGSKVITDEVGFRTPDGQIYKLGETIDGAGGYDEYARLEDVPAKYRSCVNRAGPFQLAFLNPKLG